MCIRDRHLPPVTYRTRSLPPHCSNIQVQGSLGTTDLEGYVILPVHYTCQPSRTVHDLCLLSVATVSYTHLDVYKRQVNTVLFWNSIRKQINYNNKLKRTVDVREFCVWKKVYSGDSSCVHISLLKCCPAISLYHYMINNLLAILPMGQM